MTPGSLTPKQEEHLVHLAVWMPFAHAARMLQSLTGVQVSEATVRRHTEQAGQIAEEGQNEQSREAFLSEPPQTQAPAQMGLSADGAFVPLVGGVWAEVRMLAIGEVERTGEQTCTTNLSYFARMTDAATFEELIQGEMQQRQILQAKQVAGVTDGAEWLQGLLDLQWDSRTFLEG